MKKLILLTFLFIQLISVAQQGNNNKQNRIDGLGTFKVGKTTLKQMPFLIDSNTGKLNYDTSSSEYKSNDYEIAGVLLRNFNLEFFHDTLFRLSCDAQIELTDLLSLKYGKPKVLKKLKSCSLGSVNAEELIHYYPTTKKELEAHYITGSYDESKIQTSTEGDVGEKEKYYIKNMCDEIFKLGVFEILDIRLQSEFIKENIKKTKLEQIKKEKEQKKRKK